MGRSTAVVAVAAALLLAAGWLAIRAGNEADCHSSEPRARLSPPAAAPVPVELPVPARSADPVESGPAARLAVPEVASEAGDDLPLPADLAEIVARYRGAGTREERDRTLLELALTDAPESLSFLLDELARVDREEQESVLSAVVQLGSRDAVPRLREMALGASSPDEARRFTKAADYLELPSLTEIRRGPRGR